MMSEQPERLVDLFTKREKMQQVYDQRQKTAAIPSLYQLIDTGKTMGSHGSRIYKDPQGEWLLKKPNKGNEFLIPLDLATTALQQRMGLPAPETHALPMVSKYGKPYMATAVKMFPGAQEAWQHPPHLHDLSPQDLMTVQKHHALDWLLANHDAHTGNWMTTPEHGLVGVDKGQSLKYFGQDKLDPHFKPNYYAREPIHNRLWREYAAGSPGQLNDPREGELGHFVQGLQAIPDEEFADMFRPYAHAAAKAGMLGTGKYGSPHGDADPNRGLTPPTIPPNDPEAFVNALVARKNSLTNDLGAYFDQAATQRASSALSGKPFEPESDKPKYMPADYTLDDLFSGHSYKPYHTFTKPKPAGSQQFHPKHELSYGKPAPPAPYGKYHKPQHQQPDHLSPDYLNPSGRL